MTASACALMAAVAMSVIESLIASPASAGNRYVSSSDANISQGRELWMQNREPCHGYGIAVTPVPINPNEWIYRLSKGEQVLYEHAINGFIGPDYSMMPARGGNEDLNDEEVKLAVDYMIFLASYYINKRIINTEVNYDSTTN